MATAIQVSPGATFPTVVLQAYATNGTPIAGNLTVTALKDVTINSSKDVFTYTVLSQTGKQVIPTTSTDSIATNLVVDETIHFGSNAAGTTAAEKGLMGLSKDGVKCKFWTTVGSKTLSGNCYVTGLAATVSADSPVWVSPATFNVTDSSYTITG